MKQVAEVDEFNSELKTAGNRLVCVDFYATWCGPCKTIAPKVMALEQKYSDVVFFKVDVDEAEEIVSMHDVKAMPTFKLFRKGQLITEVVGASIESLEDAIIKFL